MLKGVWCLRCGADSEYPHFDREHRPGCACVVGELGSQIHSMAYTTMLAVLENDSDTVIDNLEMALELAKEWKIERTNGEIGEQNNQN